MGRITGTRRLIFVSRSRKLRKINNAIGPRPTGTNGRMDPNHIYSPQCEALIAAPVSCDIVGRPSGYDRMEKK